MSTCSSINTKKPPGGFIERVKDLTGSYQLVESDNFEGLLAVQGVPWALRVAASRLRPIHHLTHDVRTDDLTIRIEGIIDTQTSYKVDGVTSMCSEVRGRKFRDTLEYMLGGVRTLKRAVDDGYTVEVCRVLNEDHKILTMTSTVTFDDASKEKVKSIQIFVRVPKSA